MLLISNGVRIPVVPHLFTARLRRITNSLRIPIPREVLRDLGAKDGDIVQVALPPGDARRRNEALNALAGIARGARSFRREKDDRF